MSSSRPQQILERSAELFAQRGYLAVSVDEIGQAVGISGPALYRHFAGKGDILARLVGLAADRVEAELDRVFDETDDPVATLDACIAMLSRLVVREGTVVGLYQREYRHLPESERRRVILLQGHLASKLESLVRAIRPELPPKQVSWLVRMLDGVFSAMREPDAPDGPDAELLTTQVMRSLLLGPAT